MFPRETEILRELVHPGFERVMVAATSRVRKCYV
jgi:hypothetical protein